MAGNDTIGPTGSVCLYVFSKASASAQRDRRVDSCGCNRQDVSELCASRNRDDRKQEPTRLSPLHEQADVSVGRRSPKPLWSRSSNAPVRRIRQSCRSCPQTRHLCRDGAASPGRRERWSIGRTDPAGTGGRYAARSNTTVRATRFGTAVLLARIHESE